MSHCNDCEEIEKNDGNLYDFCDNCDGYVGENDLHCMRRGRQAEAFVCEIWRDSDGMMDWTLVL